MSRFPRVYLLHGKGGSPNGTVKLLKHTLVPIVNGMICIRPGLPHGDHTSPATDSVLALHFLRIPPSSLLIGISLGGLVAARFQEEVRPDLHVIAISSPTWVDDVQLQEQVQNRYALYSAADPVIQGRTKNWPLLSQAYDLPWLSHDTDRHLPQLAPILARYINGDEFSVDMEERI